MKTKGKLKENINFWINLIRKCWGLYLKLKASSLLSKLTKKLSSRILLKRAVYCGNILKTKAKPTENSTNINFWLNFIKNLFACNRRHLTSVNLIYKVQRHIRHGNLSQSFIKPQLRSRLFACPSSSCWFCTTWACLPSAESSSPVLRGSPLRPSRRVWLTAAWTSCTTFCACVWSLPTQRRRSHLDSDGTCFARVCSWLVWRRHRWFGSNQPWTKLIAALALRKAFSSLVSENLRGRSFLTFSQLASGFQWTCRLVPGHRVTPELPEHSHRGKHQILWCSLWLHAYLWRSSVASATGWASPRNCKACCFCGNPGESRIAASEAVHSPRAGTEWFSAFLLGFQRLVRSLWWKSASGSLKMLWKRWW